jgi:hypothetical protein
MILESIVVVLLLFVALLVVYKGSVQEYQILQKDWSPNIEWSPLLSEQLPIVIRNVPQEWRGSWTRKATEHKSWSVYVESEDALQKTTWKEWLQSPPGEPHPSNTADIASIAKLPVQEWLDGGFRRWSWLPSTTPHTFVLTSDQPLPLRKTTAAATLVQVTDGESASVWLAHDGVVPSELQEEIKGRNPWSLSSEEVPLMEEVKFIEIKLRPGNALIIPTHWWFAVKGPTVSKKVEGVWGWTTTFQTPVSWVVSRIVP